MANWRTQLSTAIGVAVAAVLLVTTATVNSPGSGVFAHTECRPGQYLGNVTVWLPGAVIAAPFQGSESGSVEIWGKTPAGTTTLSQDTYVGDGNVTAFYVDYVNLSVFSLQDVSIIGPGSGAVCSSAMIAYISPNPAEGLHSGGVSWFSMYSGLASERGLPNGLNASQLCLEVENSTYGSCAMSTQFDLNFERTSGTVDTCGKSQDQVLQLSSQAWPVTTPFEWNNRSYSVPFDPDGAGSPGYGNGTEAWYNYTFPANGGIWEYDNLSDTSSTGAGLVFSYSACP